MTMKMKDGRVIDYGSAYRYGSQMMKHIETGRYLAPEATMKHIALLQSVAVMLGGITNALCMARISIDDPEVFKGMIEIKNIMEQRLGLTPAMKAFIEWAKMMEAQSR